MDLAENAKNTETYRNLTEKKCFYSIFCQKNDRKSLKIGFLSVFERNFKISQKFLKIFGRKSPKFGGGKHPHPPPPLIGKPATANGTVRRSVEVELLVERFVTADWRAVRVGVLPIPPVLVR